jgi:hypothetical protein
MAVTRPLKEGSVTTYQQKVALGFPDILASEADADLDTIYAAWNGGVATANLIDGSVTNAKIADVAWNKLTGGTVAAGGDLAGSTYPNPVVAAGTITKAKLGTDVGGVVATDLGTPTIGQSTTAFVRLLNMTGTTLVANRVYRLLFGGNFSKAVACDLNFSVGVGAIGVMLTTLSPAGTASESALYAFALRMLFTGTQVFVDGHVDISGAVPGGTTAATAARAFMKTGFFGGANSSGPFVDIAFTASNASNACGRYQATLELL